MWGKGLREFSDFCTCQRQMKIHSLLHICKELSCISNIIINLRAQKQKTNNYKLHEDICIRIRI